MNKPIAVYCLFEQSGTFKKQFQQLGIAAIDVDICDDFGQTDICIDLFREIELAYDNQESLFDYMTPDMLVMAFFPCTYFSPNNWLFFQGTSKNFRHKSTREITDILIDRANKRSHFHAIIMKLFAICLERDLRLIIENPYKDSYLIKNIPYTPAVIDLNRRMRGDEYPKPTMYYFINCEPTRLQSIQLDKRKKLIQHHYGTGLQRSLITSDYARNFICDFILGRQQSITQPTLF